MQSFLRVPTKIRTEVLGNLHLTDKVEASEFSHLDEQLAIGLASAARRGDRPRSHARPAAVAGGHPGPGADRA